jgi:hypothetical protein
MNEETKQIIREIITEGDCRLQHAGTFEDFIYYLKTKYKQAWIKENAKIK